MDLEKKAIRDASASSVIVGIAITLFTWGCLWFDLDQIVQVSTMLMLCFLLTAVQAIGPTPDCDLEFLCGPRQVIMPMIGAGIMWLVRHIGVDYSAFGRLFGLYRPEDANLAIGIAAGYLSGQVYIAASLAVNGNRGSGW